MPYSRHVYTHQLKNSCTLSLALGEEIHLCEICGAECLARDPEVVKKETWRLVYMHGYGKVCMFKTCGVNR